MEMIKFRTTYLNFFDFKAFILIVHKIKRVGYGGSLVGNVAGMQDLHVEVKTGSEIKT